MTPRKAKLEQPSVTLSEADISKLSVAEQTIKNTYHLQTLNAEMGETRDLVKGVSKEVGDINVHLATVKSDLGWIKKLGYLIGASSLGALAKMFFHW